MNIESTNCQGDMSCKMLCHTPALVCPPEQCWDRLYTPEEGLEMGTMFDVLNLPFEPHLLRGTDK